MLAPRLLKTCALSALGAGILFSCSLDQRKLAGPIYAVWIIGGSPDGGDAQGGDAQAANAGQSSADAGEGASLGGTHGGGGSAGSGNTAGSSVSMVPKVIDGCPDLDFNGKGDCTETLVANPNFVKDVIGWMAGDDTFVEWSAQNHFDDEPSGSALVSVRGYTDSDGMMQRASSQCVKLKSAGTLQVFANVFYEGGQGEGGPSLGLFFFGSQDCSGSPLGVPLQMTAGGADDWETLSAQQITPEGSGSVLVRLAVTKPYRGMVFKASFDNILIRTGP